jgi:hypothetical protein
MEQSLPLIIVLLGSQIFGRAITHHECAALIASLAIQPVPRLKVKWRPVIARLLH